MWQTLVGQARTLFQSNAITPGTTDTVAFANTDSYFLHTVKQGHA